MDTTVYSEVKLLIFDVDGVFTTGNKIYDLTGNVIAKEFYDKDFTALNVLSNTFDVVILSGDDRVNRIIFENKNIPFYHSSNKSKKYYLKIILNKYNIGPDSCIFVGDDLPDLGCIRLIPLSFCPKDSNTLVKNIVYKMLPSNGGKGVIVDLLNELNTEIMLRKKYGVL
jgi:3-deoxy-D-manno-octulosonate 8-phosphate phosphatase (KDO 8-P phosphatase)